MIKIHSFYPYIHAFKCVNQLFYGRGGLSEEDQDAVKKFSSLSQAKGQEGEDSSNMNTSRTRTPDNKQKS